VVFIGVNGGLVLGTRRMVEENFVLRGVGLYFVACLHNLILQTHNLFSWGMWHSFSERSAWCLTFVPRKSDSMYTSAHHHQ
jgi:hypothetical protein